MSKKPDFQKEWEKTKKQLVQLGKEASVLAQKGEKEIVKLSKKGMLRFDSSAATLKKEHLLYQIGKEYVKSKSAKKRTAKMKKMLADLEKVDKEIKRLEQKIKGVK